MQQLVIAVMVVVMMVAIGLRTTPQDFRAAWARPGALGLCLLANLVVIPLVASLASGLLPGPVFAGLALCAACPGGAVGPLMVGQARGDVVLAVTAMVVLSIVGAFTAPPTIALLLGRSAQGDPLALVGPMMMALVGYQLLPLLLGLGTRQWLPGLATRLAGPFQTASNVILLAVIAGMLVTRLGALRDVGGAGLVVCAGFTVASLAIGAAMSPGGPARRAVALVSGVRNISLSLLLAASWFPDPLTDAAVLSCGLFMMTVPWVVSRVWASMGAAGG